jgi:hypothetical protein
VKGKSTTGTRTRAILAIGGPIGDMDLTAGPLPAEHILNGHRGVLNALTGDDVALRVADVIRAVSPDVLVAHLRHSNHAMPGSRTPGTDQTQPEPCASK